MGVGRGLRLSKAVRQSEREREIKAASLLNHLNCNKQGSQANCATEISSVCHKIAAQK